MTAQTHLDLEALRQQIDGLLNAHDEQIVAATKVLAALGSDQTASLFWPLS